MTSSKQGSRTGRRFVWLAVSIVVAIAAYTAAWYALAGFALDRTEEVLVALRRDGDRVACENAEARGYPFRIGIFCASTFFEDRRHGVAVSTGQVRSAAQVYNPFRVVAEADGPARVSIAGLDPLDVRWTTLRSSLRLAHPLPDRISVEAAEVVATADLLGQTGADAFSADALEFHARPNGEDADIAIRFSGLKPGEAYFEVAGLPALSGVADVSWLNGAAQLAAGTANLHGASFRIRQFDVSAPNGAALSLSGDATVRPDGLLDATLQVTATDAAALGELLSGMFPEKAGQIRNAVSGLSILGSTPSLPLKISGGQMTLGFVPLGSLPPIR